jgi:site-specific DNA-methyltransferase (adenine-specific)
MINTLLHGDCLDALAGLPDVSARLIYLDPPFNTQVRRNAAAGAYDDALGGAADYVAFMQPRVEQMRRVLVADGSLFFHCDWRMSHHVKLMLDQVFDVSGAGRRKKRGGVFVNEIVWRYGLGAARVGRQLLTKHDTIFWYARSDAYTFNVMRGDPTKAMLAKYCHIEPDGRRYMMSYGKRYYMKGGKPLDDVWDIPAIAATSGERAGYPTQKPLALLERIVLLASNPGDLILDPFCGSGTTLVAARKHDRSWLGIDASADAIAVARARLAPQP